MASFVAPGSEAVVGGKNGARLRKGIEMNSMKYGELPRGSRVQVLAHGHAVDGTPRTQIMLIDGARTGWVSSKFLEPPSGAAPEAAAAAAVPAPAAAPAPPSAATRAVVPTLAETGVFAALSLEPKRCEYMTFNDYVGLGGPRREASEMAAEVMAAARACLEKDWLAGARDVARALKRADLAPLHAAALRAAQTAADGAALDVAGRVSGAGAGAAPCAVTIASDGAGGWSVRADADAVPLATAARLGRLQQFVETRTGAGSALDRVPGRVSICAFTRRGDRRHHARLYRAFVEVDWVDKELVVLDVTPGEEDGSPFFTRGIDHEPREMFEPGDRVEARWKNEARWYPATIQRRHWQAGFYDVLYDHADGAGRRIEEHALGHHLLRRLGPASGRGVAGEHRYVRQHWNEHLSTGALRNALVALATGEFVCFFDCAGRVYDAAYVPAMVRALEVSRAEMVVLHDRLAALARGDDLCWAREASGADATASDGDAVTPVDACAFRDASTFFLRASAFRPKLHPPAAGRGEKPRATTGGAFDDRSHDVDQTFRPLTVGVRDEFGIFARVRHAPVGAPVPTHVAAAPPNAAALRDLVAGYAETIRDVAPDGERIDRPAQLFPGGDEIAAAGDDEAAYY